MALSKIQLSELLSVYGAMLTDKQRDACAMYCDLDCSLSEIGSELGISRQGVRDAIVNAEAALARLESTLHLAEFCRNLNIALSNCDDDELKQIVKEYVSKE